MSYENMDGSEEMPDQRYKYDPLPRTSDAAYMRVLKLHPECVCADDERRPRKEPIIGVGHCYWCEKISSEFDVAKWEELYSQSLQWPAETNLNTWGSREQCLSPRCMMLRSRYTVLRTRVELETVSLESAPAYEALSYAWGSTELTCATAYGSQGTGQYIRVTKSCSQALTDLQPRCTREDDAECSAKPRLLWIDALCIDQTSLEERSYQVDLMGHIYMNADRVVIWPGPQRDMSTGDLEIHDDSLVYGPDYREILDFTARPYFSRIWPIQEIALSKKSVLLVGQSTSADSDEPQTNRVENLLWPFQKVHPVRSRETWIRNPLSIPYDFCPELRLHRQMWAYFHLSHTTNDPSGCNVTTAVDVSRILLDARSLDASEPRDKIFALQGMLKMMGAHFAAPDYTIPVEKIYIDATKFAIAHDQTLRILSGMTGHRKNDRMPSWVPDYSDNDSITEVADWEAHLAAGSISHHPHPNLNTQDALELHGFPIDQIDQILTTFPTSHTLRRPSELAQALLRPLDQAALSREEYLSFLRALSLPVWDASKHKWPLTNIIRRLLGEVRTTDVSRLLAETLHPVRENLVKRLDRKVLCRTRDKRLCLVSKFAKEHDTIALLAGCNLPMVLRAEGGGWKIVAPAYIYENDSSDNFKNVMDGTLWTHLQTLETPQRFTIV